MKVALAKLDLALQTRAAINEEIVKDYAALLADGTALPPVNVYADADGRLYLTDGYHRVAAARRNGAAEVDAVVVNATRADALRAALKANAAHGFMRTNADKRHALEMAWENRAELFPAGLKECHYATTLAELCGVTRPTATAFLNSGFCKIFTKPDSDDSGAEAAEKPDAASVRALLREGKDRFGTPIPEHLVPAFHLDELQQLMRQVRALGGELATCLDGGKIAFAAVPQQALNNLRNAASELKLARAFCVCRMCQGEGCHACSGRGFQTVVQYKAQPSEYRVAG